MSLIGKESFLDQEFSEQVLGIDPLTNLSQPVAAQSGTQPLEKPSRELGNKGSASVATRQRSLIWGLETLSKACLGETLEIVLSDRGTCGNRNPAKESCNIRIRRYAPPLRIQDSPRSMPTNALVTTNPGSWMVSGRCIGRCGV